VIGKNNLDDLDSIYFFDKINMRSNSASITKIPKLDFNVMKIKLRKNEDNQYQNNNTNNNFNNITQQQINNSQIYYKNNNNINNNINDNLNHNYQMQNIKKVINLYLKI